MCVITLCTRGALDTWSRGRSTAALCGTPTRVAGPPSGPPWIHTQRGAGGTPLARCSPVNGIAYERKVRELQKKAPPIRAAIKRLVEERAGQEFNTELHIGFDLELTHVGFDLWYQTDQELERDLSSGRREQLAEIMRCAAREVAKANSEVRFHSHQFVREKYHGNYFEYLR